MAFLPLLSDSLRSLSSDRRTSLCFVPPLVSVARRGQEAGDFGGRGRGGNGPRPQLPVGPFTSTQPLGMGAGLGGASLWAEGKGCWWWAAGWAELCSREAPQGNATDHCPTASHTHPSGGDQAGSPCSPDPSLFIQHFHVVRSSSELSLPLREVDAPYDNLLPSHRLSLKCEPRSLAVQPSHSRQKWL